MCPTYLMVNHPVKDKLLILALYHHNVSYIIIMYRFLTSERNNRVIDKLVMAETINAGKDNTGLCNQCIK